MPADRSRTSPSSGRRDSLMVTIGVDTHKRSHTVVAVDEQGRQLAQQAAGATSTDHLELVAWAARFVERPGAVEDCRHLSRRLARARSAGREAGWARTRGAAARRPPRGSCRRANPHGVERFKSNDAYA